MQFPLSRSNSSLSRIDAPFDQRCVLRCVGTIQRVFIVPYYGFFARHTAVTSFTFEANSRICFLHDNLSQIVSISLKKNKKQNSVFLSFKLLELYFGSLVMSAMITGFIYATVY